MRKYASFVAVRLRFFVRISRLARSGSVRTLHGAEKFAALRLLCRRCRPHELNISGLNTCRRGLNDRKTIA
jgi:hypothetical protein